MFKDKRYQEVAGIVLLHAGMILFLSLFTFDRNDHSLLSNGRPVLNIIGPLGAWISHAFRIAFGVPAYIFSAMLFTLGVSELKQGTLTPAIKKTGSKFFLAVSLSALFSIFKPGILHYSGGVVGHYTYTFMSSVMGKVGACLVILIMNFAGFILLGILSLSGIMKSTEGREKLIKRTGKLLKKLRKEKKEKIPLNYIDDDLYAKKKKLPWIIKKRISLNSERDLPERNRDSLKYLEMAVPLASEEREKNNPQDDSFYDEADEYTDHFPEEYEEEMQAPECGNSISAEYFIEELDELHPVKKTQLLEEIISENQGDEEAPEMIHYAEPAEPLIEEKIVRAPHMEEGTGIKKNRIKFFSSVPQPDETEIKNKTIDNNITEEIPISDQYIIPMDFLQTSVPIDTESWQTEVGKNSKLLVNTLAEFGIDSRVVKVNRGPVITLYEMQIGPGIKVNKIVGLSDDIAMALAASRVRIVAPIPGKSAIGVEIPNKLREQVTLGDIIGSERYREQTGALKVGLGKDILGKPVTLDLKKQPHLLIAGATGSGKSVCVNSIITSILYNYDPTHVRFIMVDPKMVELQLYNGIPHLLTPVITDPHAAPTALKWAIYEMERRYRLLSEINTRDIERYNEKIKGTRKAEKLPFIIIIIDELADLMMVASKEIEGYITRIAQKARAVGIHLVLATQRPSVDIITGIIKANFPARIAFQVAQKTDSRTIIDQNGAEKLLGKGDMLYQSPVSSFPVRIQGAFISEDEVGELIEYLATIGAPDYIDIEEYLFQIEEEKALENGGGDDELFVEALKIVEETRKASASYLQRRLSIGYNRAARIIEQMEDLGYIGPQQGSKPREVFI